MYYRIQSLILGQLSQKSTMLAIANAFILLLGYTVSPAKLEAILTITTFVNGLALAILQEKRNGNDS